MDWNMMHILSMTRRRGVRFSAAVSVLPILGLLAQGAAWGQVPSAAQRISELEARVQALEAEMESAKEKKDKDKDKEKKEKEPFFANGVFTLGGGVELRFGGQAEILLLDDENETDPVVGSTEDPDPHLEINRLRLEPRLDFNKELSVFSQIDFEPEKNKTYLRELTARYRLKPVWWFTPEARVGLDDRFTQPTRRTKNYPLIGNAFWRRESPVMRLSLKFGDKDGAPPEEVEVPEESKPKGTKKSKGKSDKEAAAPSDAPSDTPADAGKSPDGAGGSEPPADLDTDSVVSADTTEQTGDPFDFEGNLGEVTLFGSLGNGYTLMTDQIGYGKSSFNDLVQDGRDLEAGLALRELGVGLKYRRNFTWLGDLSLLGFYYDDRLNDASLDFLRNDLTIYDLGTGAPVAGYGTSDSRKSGRYGLSAEYFLPASTFRDLLSSSQEPMRAGDGLRFLGEWIHGVDGELRRKGWYVQTSYRYSLPDTWRIWDYRVLRSIEPIVRYGVLDVNLDPDPLLPGTWIGGSFFWV